MQNWPFVILAVLVLLLIFLPMITSLGKGIFLGIIAFIVYKLYKHHAGKKSES